MSGSRALEARQGAGYTTPEVQGKLVVARRTLQVVQDSRALLGNLFNGYDKEMGARNAIKVLEPIARAGEVFDAKFEQPAFFQETPLALDDYVLRKAENMRLSLLSVPDFPVQTPEELQAVVDQRSPVPPVRRIWPKPYLRGIVDGQLPLPHPRGYYVLADAPGQTRLSEILNVNMGSASIVEINAAITQRESEALAALGLTQDNAYIRLLTGKELFLDNLLRGLREGTTHTQVRGTDKHVVFDGKDVSTISSNERALAPRLGVVFGKPLKSTHYMPRTFSRT